MRCLFCGVLLFQKETNKIANILNTNREIGKSCVEKIYTTFLLLKTCKKRDILTMPNKEKYINDRLYTRGYCTLLDTIHRNLDKMQILVKVLCL